MGTGKAMLKTTWFNNRRYGLKKQKLESRVKQKGNTLHVAESSQCKKKKVQNLN